jgi:hypothetical protein
MLAETHYSCPRWKALAISQYVWPASAGNLTHVKSNLHFVAQMSGRNLVTAGFRSPVDVFNHPRIAYPRDRNNAPRSRADDP